MAHSRQKILDYIVEQQSTTVGELSKVFHVTEANIRHHLAILTEQGSVMVIGHKTNSTRGRPAQIFSSKQQSDQHNLNKLSNALLFSLTDIVGPDEYDRILEQIAIQMVSEYNTSSINPTKRLYSTILALDQMNYQAHWEAHFKHPRIILGHCPYQAIYNEHPELCQLDVSLLEYLLQTKVRQIDKQVINNKGFTQCIFLIDYLPD
jgi:predicted ArsR family transcriptional regulator